jgi:hypothetical protein
MKVCCPQDQVLQHVQMYLEKFGMQAKILIHQV